jgi:ribonuclease P protein component
MQRAIGGGTLVLTPLRVLRTLAAFRVRPAARNTRTFHEPFIDEAYLSAQQSAAQADPRIPHAHGYQEGPAGVEPSACQGAQASRAVTRGRGVPIGSFTFSARQRLRTQAEFEHVYKSGQRFGQSLFQVSACPNAHGFPRLGLSIGARTVGNAVARNRIRRVVREIFRLAQADLPAVDIVVAARAAARNASRDALRSDLERALRAVRDRCASSSNRSSTRTGG